jgi:predicted glycosyltransferase involved in capsule biosynthesis
VSTKEEYMKYHEWRRMGFGPKYKAYFETQVRLVYVTPASDEKVETEIVRSALINAD